MHIPLDENTLIERKRNLPVAKANTFVRKARYNLTTQQLRIVHHIISKIKIDDDDLKIYKFDLKEFARICGIECNGKNYANFMDSLKALRDKSFWMQEGNRMMLVSWFERLEINMYDTTVSLRLDDRLKPYLLHLQNHFTQYNYGTLLSLTCKHAIRLYEMFVSYDDVGVMEVEIDELKELLGCQEYATYYDFRRYVIEKSLQQINEYTELNVTYYPIKKGRSMHALTFLISKKSEEEANGLRFRRDIELNGC